MKTVLIVDDENIAKLIYPSRNKFRNVPKKGLMKSDYTQIDMFDDGPEDQNNRYGKKKIVLPPRATG